MTHGEPAAAPRLVFVAGAPGSRWSSVARAVAYAAEVDHSDETENRGYQGRPDRPSGRPGHFGSYFGPGMEFGDRFDRLDTLPVAELERELLRPFASPSGVLLLKSHYFARFLPYLARTFPGSRFLLAHREDGRCLQWWLACGGFDISYPRYDHYRDVAGIRAAIASDNAGIRHFAASHGVSLPTPPRGVVDVTSDLGLTFDPAAAKARARSAAESAWVDRLPGTDLLDRLDGALSGVSVVTVRPVRCG